MAHRDAPEHATASARPLQVPAIHVRALRVGVQCPGSRPPVITSGRPAARSTGRSPAPARSNTVPISNRRTSRTWLVQLRSTWRDQRRQQRVAAGSTRVRERIEQAPRSRSPVGRGRTAGSPPRSSPSATSPWRIRRLHRHGRRVRQGADPERPQVGRAAGRSRGPAPLPRSGRSRRSGRDASRARPPRGARRRASPPRWPRSATRHCSTSCSASVEAEHLRHAREPEEDPRRSARRRAARRPGRRPRVPPARERSRSRCSGASPPRAFQRSTPRSKR